VLSSTFSPTVAEDDLRGQINNIARGWHILGRGEFKVPASESFKMLATLLFQKVQQHFEARRCSIISDLPHSVWQNL
jgi:hypothetical protein